MKKYLFALAALSLTGCAYSQFKADYVAAYAGYDCGALESELNFSQSRTSPSGLEADWYRDSERVVAKARTVVVGNKVFTSGGYDARVGAPPSPDQKLRMSNHARQQAILQLQTRKGCLNKEAVTNT